jgi:hypothetical protein
MARVTYGALVTELAGSIGGVTFQKNSSGNVARLKSKKPLNPNQEQSDNNVVFAQLVALWPTLSQGNKDTWDALAAAHDHTTPWGETKTLNGFQWFMSCNRNLLLAGESIIETAPSWSSVSPPNVFTLAATSDHLTINIAAGWNYGPEYIFLYMTTPLRHSSLKLRRPCTLVLVDDTINTSSMNVESYLEALANITWADFYASAEANIIIRAAVVEHDTGLASTFTSAIIKIG